MNLRIKLLLIAVLSNTSLSYAQLLAFNMPNSENKTENWKADKKSELLDFRITQNNEKVQIDLHKSEIGIVSFALYNNKMEQLYCQIIDSNFTGNFSQILNLKNLNAGRFLIQVCSEREQKIWKIFEYQKEN